MSTKKETTLDDRRAVLKKAGAFAIPAVATFALSELQARASGIKVDGLDHDWNSFWTPSRTDWFTKPKSWWETDKEFWWTIWKAMK